MYIQDTLDCKIRFGFVSRDYQAFRGSSIGFALEVAARIVGCDLIVVWCWKPNGGFSLGTSVREGTRQSERGERERERK